MYFVFYRNNDNDPWRNYTMESTLTNAMISKEELMNDGYDLVNIKIEESGR